MSKNQPSVGILGIGLYLPKNTMSAKEMSDATGGVWSEQAVREKLGMNQKYVSSSDYCDGTEEMGALAALDCIKNTGIDPLEIDAILCFGEEWKEYPLSTSSCYIQDRIGAKNAWGIDVQNRCCSTVSAMKLAKDLLIGDEECSTVLVCGGYRNCDLIDFKDSNLSFLFNLGCGGGAILLRKGYEHNRLLGTHIISDGSVAHTCCAQVGGTAEPVTVENIADDNIFRVMDAKKLKGLLNAVSVPNWYRCVDEALRKSGKTRTDLSNQGYLDILHIKRSAHLSMLKDLGLTEEQTVYLEDYGHIGQVDAVLSLKLGLEQGKVRPGTLVCMIAAGLGYTWAANIIEWG